MRPTARVLVVSNMWPGWGSIHNGVFVQRQVEALRRARPGWTFDVHTITGARGRKDYLFAVPRLRRLLRSGYDLVHAHYGLTGVTTALAGARPLVLTLHGGEIEVPWQTPVTRFAIRRSAAVIPVSRWVADGFPDVRSDIISCGVDIGLFAPRDRAEARRRLGLPAEAKVILFPAAPREPIKNHALFRAAFERIRAELPEAVELTLGVEPDQVVWHMAAADVAVLTSKEESGPLVVKEALAVGLPVVAVDVGDVRETLEGVPGCAVVRHDAAELADATLRVLRDGRTDAPDAAALRRARIAELELDEDSVAHRILAVYDRILGRTTS